MYGVFAYKNTGNLGDAIQTIALSKLLPDKCFGAYRDTPLPALNEDMSFIANGWLGKCTLQRDVNCVFAGVHVSSSELDWIGRMRDSKLPIGVRDPYTASLLKACNVPHVLVGCATLTFEHYTGPRKGRYSIDVKERPGTDFLTNDIGGASWTDQWMLAVQRLQLLRTAELVYTNRLHVILPCLAFGTPVVFNLADLNSVSAKERLTILPNLGFVFDEEVILDVSSFADSYRAFLSDMLCRPCNDSPAIPDVPEIFSPCVSVAQRARVSSNDSQSIKPNIFYLHNARHTSSFLHQQCDHHVEVLNQHGYNAYSVSMPSDTETSASEPNRIDLSKAAEIYEPDKDYILLSGELSHADRNRISFNWPGKKVLFGVEVSSEVIMGSLGNVAGVFTLSESTRTLLRLANPALSLFQIEYSPRLNPSPYTVPEHKDPIIAILGNIIDCPREIRLLGYVLKARSALRLNNLGLFRWELLDGLSEDETKRILERSPLVFCCPNMERPWLVSEAKTYGCLVLSYGQVVSASLNDKIIQLAESGLKDIVTFIENALSKYPNWPPDFKGAITNGVPDSHMLDGPYSDQAIWNAWNKMFAKIDLGIPVELGQRTS